MSRFEPFSKSWLLDGIAAILAVPAAMRAASNST
jgi:hypothetical protein